MRPLQNLTANLHAVQAVACGWLTIALASLWHGLGSWSVLSALRQSALRQPPRDPPSHLHACPTSHGQGLPLLLFQGSGQYLAHQLGHHDV